MPSNAFGHFTTLLQGPDELLDAQNQLLALPGTPGVAVGDPWGIGAINRAAVVMFVASWEAYIERVAIEAVQCLRPAAAPFGNWSSLDAWVNHEVHRFHAPDVSSVRRLICGAVGLPDLTAFWTWPPAVMPDQARGWVGGALDVRNKVAHGANPVVLTAYATNLRPFFLQLAMVTDAAIRAHLVNHHGVSNPWPP